jgi:hypothetical protein
MTNALLGTPVAFTPRTAHRIAQASKKAHAPFGGGQTPTLGMMKETGRMLPEGSYALMTVFPAEE